MKKKVRQPLDHDRLVREISYDKETGVFKNNVTRTNSPAGRILGSKMQDGYVQMFTQGRVIYAHRLAWFYVYGEMPTLDIDHINNIRDDNRIENLRQATKRQNSYNQFPSIANKSGCIGVYFSSKHKRWHATIKKDNSHKSLGMHNSIFEAAAARKRAELIYCEGFSK